LNAIAYQLEIDLSTKIILLDTGPLGRITHPKVKENSEIAKWCKEVLAKGISVVIPEIADYELRRNLILEELDESINRLDELEQDLWYLPITTDIMRKASELWAVARKAGKSAADPKELNGDVILAAQALSINGTVATENVGHLASFVQAKSWEQLP
jgi:predicted nucleic acid-binding protein